MFDSYPEAAAAAKAAGASPADPLALPIGEARLAQDRYFAHFNADLPTVASRTDLRIEGPAGAIPIRIYRPTTAAPLPAIVFVRGAGWWAGALDSHARTMIQLAETSGCAVCGVDYRRTPEHRFPTQRDEVLATLDWLRDAGAAHGIDGGPAVLFGESAGATICLSAALARRDRGAPMPAGLVLFYNNAGGLKPTARAYSQWVWRQYLGDDRLAADPSAVPLLSDLHGLPPCWLGAGEDDPLITDTLALAQRLDAAGVPHALHRYAGLPHGFVMWSGTLRPALDALGSAARAAAAFASAARAQP